MNDNDILQQRIDNYTFLDYVILKGLPELQDLTENNDHLTATFIAASILKVEETMDFIRAAINKRDLIGYSPITDNEHCYHRSKIRDIAKKQLSPMVYQKFKQTI